MGDWPTLGKAITAAAAAVAGGTAAAGTAAGASTTPPTSNDMDTTKANTEANDTKVKPVKSNIQVNKTIPNSSTLSKPSQPQQQTQPSPPQQQIDSVKKGKFCVLLTGSKHF